MAEHETYRATGALETLAIVLVLAAGVALSIAVITQLPDDINGALGFGIMLASTLPTVAGLWFVMSKLGRRQAKQLAAVLEADGFTFDLQPSVEAQTQAVSTIGRLAMLSQSPAYVTWVARRTTAQGESVALRHSEVVGYGKEKREVVHLVVAVPLPHGVTTGVWLTRQKLLERRASDAQGAQDIQVGDPWLDKTFRILAHDPAEPARILAIAPLRDLIAAGPSRESWALAPSHAMCIFRADTNAHGIGVMLRRATRAAQLLAQHRQAPAAASVPAAAT